jgi:hypothetical protein
MNICVVNSLSVGDTMKEIKVKFKRRKAGQADHGTGTSSEEAAERAGGQRRYYS